MRNGGGYTPAGQRRRERLQLEATGRFARGEETRSTRSPGTCGSRRGRCGGGGAPGRTAGPQRCGRKSRCRGGRLSPQQWARLEQELRKGPLAHGFGGDKRDSGQAKIPIN